MITKEKEEEQNIEKLTAERMRDRDRDMHPKSIGRDRERESQRNGQRELDGERHIETGRERLRD